MHSSETTSFLSKLPATLLPVCYGMDANTPIRWDLDGEGLVAGGQEGKGDNMLGWMREKGLELTSPPQSQRFLPTCRPRKRDVQGRHIDVVGGKHCGREGMGVLRDSHKWVGSDHDMVLQRLTVRLGDKEHRPRPNTRPKRVVAMVEVPDVLNQQVMEGLATKYTKPYKGCAYRDPEHVRVCLGIARRTGTAESWKRVQAERATARRTWREERIRAATSGDWKAYRDCAKKGTNGWEDHLAHCLVNKGHDPHVAIHDHFAHIYQGSEVPEFPYRELSRSPDFTLQELHNALDKGKTGKSNGEDGVPHELLQAIAANARGEKRLLDWFNRLLHGEEPLPESWSRAVMSLLPKCSLPESPKQLRPICLGSSTSKVYSRMLLMRSRSSFKYSGPFQNMGEGRQTVDYIWVISRLMQLDQEWKEGLWFLKLDIEKAFDTLHRGKFLHKLAEKMGPCEELRAWWDLFRHTEATLPTPWGRSVVPMHTGIRQGAVESPQVFAAAMDWIVQEVASKFSWGVENDSYQGMQFAESAFVDDCILWNGSKDKLSQRAGQLIQGLAEWGMRVNPSKCQVYATPFVKETGPLQVGPLTVGKDEKLDVMGIPFRAGISPKEAMQVVFNRTKKKFWALQHLFRAKTSLGGRLKLLQRVLGGTSLWCVSAFVPDQNALKAINVLQSQLVIWSMRLARGRSETWLEFRMRSFRVARYVILQHMGERWSTHWLRRCWLYAGHRARGIHLTPTPGCSLLDSYRNLEWWQEQQGLSTGHRHKGRFFPRLMSEEKAMNRAAGGPWREVAQNREGWRQCTSAWIEQQDLPWSSGVQLALAE